MSKIKYKLIQGTELKNYLGQFKEDEPLACDTETIGLYGKIRLIQFYQAHWDEALLVEWPSVMEITALLSNQLVVFHNGPYDLGTIQDNLGKVPWYARNYEDTFYLSRLYYFKEDSFTLDSCMKYALGYDPYDQLPYDKKELQKSDWGKATLDVAQLEYAATDVLYLLPLYDKVKEMKDSFSYKLDIISVKNMLRWQVNGFDVNERLVEERIIKDQARLEEIDLPINANSYIQVRKYLDTSFSDDEGLARIIAGDDPERAQKAKDVRETRKLRKELNFLEKYSKPRIYGHFGPNTRSGRSNCKEDNLQQIPRVLKCLFGYERDDEWLVVYSDFSQLELRGVTAVVNETNMERLYRAGEDIHLYTAKMLFQTENPDKEQRRIAKTCNFGLLYGASAKTFVVMLLTMTGIVISHEEAVKLRNKWLKLWPTIAMWQKQGINMWRRGQHKQTPMGRRYTGKLITDHLNCEIQGFGAEAARLANHYMEERLDKIKSKYGDDECVAQMNFIHDSYLLRVKKNEELYKEVAKAVADSMQEAWFAVSQAAKIKDLPMPVDVFVGYNWGEIEDDEEYVYKLEQE